MLSALSLRGQNSKSLATIGGAVVEWELWQLCRLPLLPALLGAEPCHFESPVYADLDFQTCFLLSG